MNTLLAPSAAVSLVFCLLGLVFSSAAAADDELSRLRSFYQAAVEKALQPLRESYETKLRRLAETRTRNSDLDGVLAVNAELERVGKRIEEGGPEEQAKPNESNSVGVTSEDAEIQSLRATYESAVDRAVQPLRETYKRELNRIVQTRTRNSDLEGALAARAELERISGKQDEDGEKLDSGSSRRPPDEFFVNRTWVSSAGTAFTFKEGGVCIRQSGGDAPREGKWRRRGSLVISDEEDGNPRTTRYFRFDSETEAWYGNGPNEMDSRVTPR